MKKGDALYEFINRYAYFANPANIVVENYSARDGNIIEADIILELFRFMSEYDKAQESVKSNAFLQEEVDVKLRTAIYELRLQTVDRFLNVLSRQIEKENSWNIVIELDSISKERQKMLQPYSEKSREGDKLVVKMHYVKECLFNDIRRKIRRESFSADQLVKFIEDIRSFEEFLI